MAGKTFPELKEALRSWLAIDQEDDEERLSDAVAGDIINIVRRDYLRQRESRLGEATSVYTLQPHTSCYLYPADFSKPRKFWYVNSKGGVTVVKWMDKDQFDTTYPYSGLLAIPGVADLALEGGGSIELEGGGTLVLTRSMQQRSRQR